MKYVTLLFIAVILCLHTFVQAKVPALRTYKANSTELRYMGRTLVSDDGAVSFDWAGIRIYTRLNGGYLAARVSDLGESYYNVFVNDKLLKTVKVTGKDTLVTFVEGLKPNMQRICIQKRSEGEYGRTTIHHFEVKGNGSLEVDPRTTTRHIEFIGNSLTSGYGTDGKHRDEPFLVATENCNLTYASIIARYFDADYTLLSHSGRGAVRNYGDTARVSKITMKDRMLNVFDEDQNLKWDFSKYQPDLVVINLGSNDYSSGNKPRDEEFIAAYKQIIAQLRMGYGSVAILCIAPPRVGGPVFECLTRMQRELGDKNVHVQQLPYMLWNDTSDMGAAWHPGYQGQMKMAMTLIPHISTIKGWEFSGKPLE